MEPDPDRFREDGPPRWSARWWLARLAFSFVVLAAVAGYEGLEARRRGHDARATILFAGAAAGVALAAAGLRLRHRP